MTEREDQAALIAWAKKHNLFVRKLVCAGHRGFPDLLVGNPRRKKHLFLELKTPDGKLTPLQRRTILDMNGCGMQACVAYSLEEAQHIISAALGVE